MPTLLEMQSAIGRTLRTGEPCELRQYVAADGVEPEARLSVYRNTFLGTLTTALRLAFPAVHRLVGGEFFEAAAQIYIEGQPARSANLNEYGEDFPVFLETLPSAATRSYLADVARLDWAVNCALHAPDVNALDPSTLTELEQDRWELLKFTAHPSVGFVHSAYPIDHIWRGVLFPGAVALDSIDLASGAVWLVIQRVDGETRVDRMGESAWKFAQMLCVSQPLGLAMEGISGQEAAAMLGEHLAAGRFVGFRIEPPASSPPEMDKPE